MTRSATANAEAAAEALEAFLRGRPDVNGHTASAVTRHTTVTDTLKPETSGPNTRVTGRVGHSPNGAVRPAMAPHVTPPLRLPHTDWLHHRLTVTGPADTVAAFRNVACGAGTIPWQLDIASLEEDWFHRLVDPAHRSLSLQGARVLAAQLREAVERRHTLAVARVGHSRACSFDLHALVPVPPAILALGPDHPDALVWLWQHWGTTEVLRHVTMDTADEARRGGEPSGSGWRLRFWSADWTPWHAIVRIRTDWPAPQFDVQPSYE